MIYVDVVNMERKPITEDGRWTSEWESYISKLADATSGEWGESNKVVLGSYKLVSKTLKGITFISIDLESIDGEITIPLDRKYNPSVLMTSDPNVSAIVYQNNIKITGNTNTPTIITGMAI